MNIFISGGCKNGKSDFAQEQAVKLAKRYRQESDLRSDGSSSSVHSPVRLYYVATMIPYDDEDRARIKKHIENRAGLGFETLELGRDLMSRISDPDGVYLVDSVTALLLNELFPSAEFACADPDGVNRCRDELLALAGFARGVVFVSDYIYSDAARYDEFTENYRRSLASVDAALAEVCDMVIELCAGNVVYHKRADLPDDVTLADSTADTARGCLPC